MTCFHMSISFPKSLKKMLPHGILTNWMSPLKSINGKDHCGNKITPKPKFKLFKDKTIEKL